MAKASIYKKLLLSAEVRFLFGVPIGIFCVLATCILLLQCQLGVPTEMSRWVFELVQKKVQLASECTSQKLLMVGGSNVLFGISAESIEHETGIRTINMGTHGSMELPYILYLAEKVAKPNDIVVLVLEYDLYGKNLPTDFTDNYILSRDPDYFHKMSWYETADMATRLPTFRYIEGFEAPLYGEARYNVSPYNSGYTTTNNNGDEIANPACLGNPASPTVIGRNATLADFKDRDLQGFQILHDFLLWARAHQVIVAASFPSVVYHEYYNHAPTTELTRRVVQFYESEHVSLLDQPTDTMLPASDFFDTSYHLNHEAALARTERLIPKIQEFLSDLSNTEQR